MKEDSDLSKLIRLKRYEQPPESYFEDFLREFQKRQRAELLRKSTSSIFLERLATYVADFGRPRALAAAGACCLAFIGFVVSQNLDSAPGAGEAIAEARKTEIPSPPPLAEPLPLPAEVVDGPLEIYPVGIQKVGASYYLLQELPDIHSPVIRETDRSTYRLPVIDLTGSE